MGTLELATLKLEPGKVTTEDQPCEVCGYTVTLFIVRTPEGSPDLVTPNFPDGAWLGWNLVRTEGQPEVQSVRLIVLCSRSCMVEWVDLEHGPGI